MACCIIASLHNSVYCCFALLLFIMTWQHEIYCGVLLFFKAFSAKQKKKAKEKRNHYSIIEENALSDNYMENVIKCPCPKMTDETRVWPVKSTIRPDIIRWPAVILSPAWSELLSTIENQMTSKCSKLCSKTTHLRIVAFGHFDIISMAVKSTEHGKLLSICKIEHGKLLQFVKAGPLHYFSVIWLVRLQ